MKEHPSRIGARPGPFATLAISVLVLLGPSPTLATTEYDFTLVEAFQPDYDLRECQIWDLNDQGRACGTSTDLPFYSGFLWALPTDKAIVPITWPRGINNAGLIVGGNVVLDSGTGLATTIPIPSGAVQSPQALGVNDEGIVVGYAQTCFCSDSDKVLRIPFVWDRQNGVRSVAVPGGKELVRINQAGLAAGTIRGGGRNAFVYDVRSGTYTTLNPFLPPGSTPWTESQDINDLGMVTGIGRSDDNSVYRGFVWSAAAGLTFLPPLFGDSSRNLMPWGINDDGFVVGMAEASDGYYRAFIWDAARGMRDLNALTTPPQGFVLDRATRINDQGWVAGDGHYGPGWGPHIGFVLRPVQQTSGVLPPETGPTVSLRVFPVPARGNVTIQFTLDAAAHARVRVFDVQGRVTAGLLNADLEAGPHSIHWDGRNTAGERVAPGVYFARIDAGDQASVRPVVMVDR